MDIIKRSTKNELRVDLRNASRGGDDRQESGGQTKSKTSNDEKGK